MSSIPDELIQAAEAAYQSTVDESNAFSLDVAAMISGIREQVRLLVAAKVPVEYGLTVEYQPQLIGFNSHEPHYFFLKADNIAPIGLTVRVVGELVATDISVSGTPFSDLLTAIGYARRRFVAQAEAEANAQQQQGGEFVTLEQ